MNKRYIKQMLLGLQLSFLLIPLLLGGCTLEDNRDICCKAVCLDYRYVRQNRDEFSSKIDHICHFLFDGQGYFLREVPQKSNFPQRVWLYGLAEGNYTMVSLANTTLEKSSISKLAVNSSLSDFKLAVSHHFDNKNLGNVDDLYWSCRPFKVLNNKRSHYYCDLSSITCHLFLKVRWESKPPFAGSYSYCLSNVPTNYSLDPSKVTLSHVIYHDVTSENKLPGAKQVVHTFPSIDGDLGQYAISEKLFGKTLYGEFVTLRYTNDYIPTLQLFHEDQPITKALDLGRAFRSWGWLPDSYPLQRFHIELLIKDDGHVVVNQWVSAFSNDWEDGGMVGIPKGK